MTAVLVWLEGLPWYEAATYASLTTSAFIIGLVGLQHIRFNHTINKKIAVSQLQVAHIAPGTKPKSIIFFLMVHLSNTSNRPIYFIVDRVSCHIDRITHAPKVEMKDPMQIQPGQSSGGVAVPPIENVEFLDRQMAQGVLELELRYGIRPDALTKKYKTNGGFSVYIVPTPLGMPAASIVATGAQAHYF